MVNVFGSKKHCKSLIFDFSGQFLRELHNSCWTSGNVLIIGVLWWLK